MTDIQNIEQEMEPLEFDIIYVLIMSKIVIVFESTDKEICK